MKLSARSSKSDSRLADHRIADAEQGAALAARVEVEGPARLGEQRAEQHHAVEVGEMQVVVDHCEQRASRRHVPCLDAEGATIGQPLVLLRQHVRGAVPAAAAVGEIRTGADEAAVRDPGRRASISVGIPAARPKPKSGRHCQLPSTPSKVPGTPAMPRDCRPSRAPRPISRSSSSANAEETRSWSPGPLRQQVLHVAEARPRREVEALAAPACQAIEVGDQDVLRDEAAREIVAGKLRVVAAVDLRGIAGERPAADLAGATAAAPAGQSCGAQRLQPLLDARCGR